MNSQCVSRIYYFSAHLLSFWRIHFEFTISFANLLSISRLNYDFTFRTTNSLSFSRKYNEFTTFTAISLRIHCLFREFTFFVRYYTLNSLCVSRIHYFYANSLSFLEFTMNLRWVLRFTMNFREITMNSLFFSQIRRGFSVWSANSLRRYTMNSPSFTQVHYNFLSLLQIKYEFTWCSADSLWIIHFTNSKLIYFLFRDSKMNSLSVSRIRYLFHENTMNSLSFSRLNYDFTFCSTNSLSISRKNNEFTTFSAITTWIHYFFSRILIFANPNFRESFFSRIHNGRQYS